MYNAFPIIAIFCVLCMFWCSANIAYAKRRRFMQVRQQLFLFLFQVTVVFVFLSGLELPDDLGWSFIFWRSANIGWPGKLLVEWACLYSLLIYSCLCAEQLVRYPMPSDWSAIKGESFYVREFFRRCQRNWLAGAGTLLWAASNTLLQYLVAKGA
jgi:hypothetical protein